MKYFLDINYKSINKFGEELCGDKVEIIKNDDEYIIVLSDGLGSGVKANILSTLTSKIAATMIKNGATLEETIETIISTLPECKVRKLAYSTFTIIKIDKNLDAYIAEYDSPNYFYYSNNENKVISKNCINVKSKIVCESNIKLDLGDSLHVISDGAIHAGIGELLNLGWGWEEINKYLLELNKTNLCSQTLNGNFIGVCNNLYNNKPGDDTTILSIKVRKPEYVSIFIGPPVDKRMDKEFSKLMSTGTSKKVICGGTTAIIAQRELGREIAVDIDTLREGIPPIAYMEGFDLVTEGILTLGKTLEKIKLFNKNLYENFIDDKDYNGCSLLTKILIEECTNIDFYIGRAVNPAHQNPNFPDNFNIKKKVIDDIIVELKKAGKIITVTYF